MKNRLFHWGFFLFFALSPTMAWASGANDPVIPVLLGLMTLFLGAKVGGYLASKCHQPAVLGELVAGVCLGNLGLFGWNHLDFISQGEIFSIFASIGVILLLFEVGLESSLSDLLRVGMSATLVALVGVMAPLALGYLVSWFFLPEHSHYVHIFVGAALCATSVGITARVFKDLGKVHIPEAKIILGAAVIDDVLGLIILAVVTAVIVSADHGGEALSYGSFALIAFKAFGFLALSILLGAKIAPLLFQFGARLRMEGMLLSLALIFCFLLSYLATLVGLAPIVGAFAAGLIIDGSGFAKFFGENEPSLEHLLHPVAKFFVPIFFVHMGMQVQLTTFADWTVIGLGLSLTVVAILSKQVCGLAVWDKSPGGRPLKRMLIGVGMIPRGEVGLIFAVLGSQLMLHGQPVIDANLYSALVLMVILTTMITPPALKALLK